MRFFNKAVIFIGLTAALAGCTNDAADTDSKPSKEGQALQIKIDQTAFALKQWKVDGSHRSSIDGTLMQGDKPIVNAVLQVGDNKRSIETDEDGSFQFHLDQSLLGETNVHVVSLDNATIEGEPIAEGSSNKDEVAPLPIKVYYPIEIIGSAVSTQNSEQTEIKGRLVADKTASVAFFQEDKFKISGIVNDADGHAVQGAVVWIDRDAGEGFAKSSPTDEDGRYSMYYLPEEDEATNLSVTIGTVKYTLPKNKVFHIPEDTSVSIDISLPQEGTVIVDKPPTLVSHTAPGALYLGMLVGLDVAQDVSYSVTIPDAEGNFTITVPTKVWEQNPTFFETNMSKFIEKDKYQAGDSLPSSFIEIDPGAPRNIKGESKT